ncbi:hypothetical protein RB195_024189 [Necator americanus]|uniref:Importin N-terminal domain-containing protein n=1 Tax=Necator americanus TaxID=51031 RepID=A0ABR1EMA7_NECAM
MALKNDEKNINILFRQCDSGTTQPQTPSPCSRQRGFTPQLLNIVCDGSIAEPVRQAAVIYFKNAVVRLWEVDEEAGEKSGNLDVCLADNDKALIKEGILDAVCAASESLRTQLCIAVQQIIRMDFPDRWPQFIAQLTTKLSNPPDASVLSAGLLMLYRLSKVYEFKRNKDRDDIAGPISKLEPFVYYHCNQLLNNQSAGSVLIQSQGLKIIYVLTQFSIHFEMLAVPRLDVWIKFSIDVLMRECPQELSSLEDKDERAHTVWWKCKKWAAKILDRIFDRYGSPNQVEKQYAAFANHFLVNWSRPALAAMLMILNAHRNGIFVSDRVLFLALSFTNTAVAHSHCWRTMKPHALELIKTVLFHLMSYTKADEEMWEDNAAEFVRFKFDIFEDLHNPAAGAGALLRGLAKRKDIVQPVLSFAVQVLQQSSNSYEVEGALRMIGELNQHLTKSKKYKKDVERMLDALVISRLHDPSKFIRARAAWCLKEYSDTFFHTKSIIVKAIDGLIQIMCDPNEELPVKVESALAIQSFLEDQERAHALTKPHVRSLVLQILDIVSKAQIDEVIGVVDELLEQFVEEVIPVAAEVAEHLVFLHHLRPKLSLYVRVAFASFGLGVSSRQLGQGDPMNDSL